MSGLIGIIVALPGCEPGPVEPIREARPFDGQRLTWRCPDAAFAKAISPMVKSWEVRTGATVALVNEMMTPTDDTDIGIIPVTGLGAWAEPGLLAPVPLDLKKSDHPFHWFALLSIYADRFAEWGGQTMAIPLTGDGHVLVYRADRLAEKAGAEEFQTRFARKLAAPATWEEFADVAVFFAERDKKPSLPALPVGSDPFFDAVSRVASSADRRALTDVEMANRADRAGDALQFSVPTGQPRLTSFGFQQAAKWLDRIRPALPAPGAPTDPAAALAEGRAVLAVLALEELARLPRENGVVPERFGIAGVPGTRFYFNADTGKPVQAPNVNYIPYFAGGRLGVVRARSPHQQAAFDLLAELGGPARSAEFIATPGLGAGPLRLSQLDRDRLLLWLGYGFDAKRSEALQDALRHYTSQTVKNPTFGLRGPDRAALVPAVAEPIRGVLAGAKPEEALTKADAAWKAVDAKTPELTRLRWRSAGGQ